MKVVYGIKVEPIATEKECGDQYCVKEEENSTLIAVADGLGHGEEAALAAKAAIAIIRTQAEKSLNKLIEICHEALQFTRGTALTIVRIAEKELTWVGVGNVLVAHYHYDLLSKNNSPYLLLSQPGIVGYNLPIVHSSTLKVNSKDILIFFTDGIEDKFIVDLSITEYIVPQNTADFIFKNYRNINDDALVLVAHLT